MALQGDRAPDGKNDLQVIRGKAWRLSPVEGSHNTPGER